MLPAGPFASARGLIITRRRQPHRRVAEEREPREHKAEGHVEEDLERALGHHGPGLGARRGRVYYMGRKVPGNKKRPARRPALFLFGSLMEQSLNLAQGRGRDVYAGRLELQDAMEGGVYANVYVRAVTTATRRNPVHACRKRVDDGAELKVGLITIVINGGTIIIIKNATVFLYLISRME